MRLQNTKNCNHKGAGKDWLNMPNGIVRAHPYCTTCGKVKNISSDRGKKLSYFVSVFSKMRKELEKKGYKVSDVQMRLVFKELPEDFEDVWSITYTTQKEVFVKAVTKYVRVSKDFIESML